MPVYAFQCRHPKCGHKFDLSVPVATMKAHAARSWNALPCPRCTTVGPKMLHSAPAIIGAKSIVLDPGAPNTPPELAGREFKSWAQVDAAKAELGLYNCGDTNPTTARKEIEERPSVDAELSAKIRAMPAPAPAPAPEPPAPPAPGGPKRRGRGRPRKS